MNTPDEYAYYFDNYRVDVHPINQWWCKVDVREANGSPVFSGYSETGLVALVVMHNIDRSKRMIKSTTTDDPYT